MNISREEAEQSLQAIRQVESQIRRSLASGSTPYHMILWGALWFIGYLGSHILDADASGRVWLLIAIGGGVASGFMGYRFGSRIRIPGSERIWQIWLFLFLYVVLWTWVSWPLEVRQISILIVLYTMFVYVLMGLWIGRFITWVGLTVSALGLIGYWLLPDFFNLWMAFLGGGTLFGSGVFILRVWK